MSAPAPRGGRRARPRAGTLSLLLLALALLSAAPARGASVQVSIEGLEGELLANARALLEIWQQRGEVLRPGRIRLLHRRAPEQIREALAPFGHYRVEVEASLERTDDLYRATYRVAPGEPVPVSAVDIELQGAGAEDPAFRELVSGFPLAAGDPLRHATYEQGKARFQRVAADRGYLDARFREARVAVDLTAYEARVVLRFHTGPRYRFGPVRFEQDLFREDFLRRFLTFAPGDPYEARALLRLQSALVNSGYFGAVEVLPRLEARDGLQVPVDVDLAPRKRDLYKLGVGYGTDTGPRLSAGWDRRYVNRRGHSAEVELRLSPNDSSLRGDYRIPLADPQRDRVHVSVVVADESTESRDSRTFSLGVGRVTTWGHWERRYGLGYQYEDFEVAGESDTSSLLIPGIGFVYLSSDDAMHPTRAERYSLHLEGSSEALLSDSDMLRLTGGVHGIRSVGPRGRLLARAEAGGLLVGQAEDLPASLRYYAGGDDSVRGYGRDELGPENAEGEVVGGGYLLVASLEYDHRVAEKWLLAAFVDTGNAFDDFEEPLRTGVGVGVRWLSPVGPVRVDIARGLDHPEDPWRLHIAVGPSF